MLNELLMASQGVQALGTLLKAANGLANYNEIVEKVADVNAKLMQANAVALAAQEKQAALSAEIRELREEIARITDWSKEAATYEPREVASGIFTCVPVGYSGKLQSAQKLCLNCFNQRQRSVLQQQNVEVGRQLSLVCHRCKASIIFRHYAEQA